MPDEGVRPVARGVRPRAADAGVAVGSGDVVAYTTSVATLDPGDLVDVYWAGRTTLVARVDDIPVYDRVFLRFFLDAPDEPDERDTVQRPGQGRGAGSAARSLTPSHSPARRRSVRPSSVCSPPTSAVLRSKSFAACTPDELAAVHRIMRTMRLAPPRRRSRRTTSAPAGRHRTSAAPSGRPCACTVSRRRCPGAAGGCGLRPLILILDVSGSMADYSRSLVQFAYSASRANTRVEVFCFGTRLTRITRELDRRRPDEALDRAAKAVFDWEGGTRIGESLDAFVRDWGRRGVCRGGIVVICSDGLDRGDPHVLATAMERLSRLSHRVVWMNPHKGDSADFRPARWA